jgi:hypothetical protein
VDVANLSFWQRNMALDALKYHFDGDVASFTSKGDVSTKDLV